MRVVVLWGEGEEKKHEGASCVLSCKLAFGLLVTEIRSSEISFSVRSFESTQKQQHESHRHLQRKYNTYLFSSFFFAYSRSSCDDHVCLTGRSSPRTNYMTVIALHRSLEPSFSKCLTIVNTVCCTYVVLDMTRRVVSCFTCVSVVTRLMQTRGQQLGTA